MYVTSEDGNINYHRTILDDDVDPFAKVSMRGKAHRFMR